MRNKATNLHPVRQWYSTEERHELGIIHLEHGTVIVSNNLDFSTDTKWCWLNVNCNGKIYKKLVHDWYSRRFCTTLAKRFMADVIELSKQSKQL